MTIPEELCNWHQWVTWRYVNGTKVPFSPGMGRASTTNPSTWTTYEKARRLASSGLYAGVGFVFSKDDPYVGIDLDDCLTRIVCKLSGVVSPSYRISKGAQAVLEALKGYQEISPSRRGVKIWVRAELESTYKKAGLEIYPHARFFTVTGEVLAGSGKIEDATAALEEIIRENGLERSHAGYVPAARPRIDLRRYLESAGVMLRGERSDATAREVYDIICPWAALHTGRDTSGTRVGQYENGARFFCCEHAHCARRSWRDFTNLLVRQTLQG